MKKRITALALAALMVVGTVAAAAGAEKVINVTPMSITINGQAVTPTKSDGTAAEVFAYEGATYVPLRYLSELLGIQVDWDNTDSTTAKLVNVPVTPFAAEYEIVGTTSAGLPKNDTFIFEGTTDANGIIKTLNFDIIRNKGFADEYSKKGIMGYLMNISDAEVTKTETGWSLPTFGINGYEEAFGLGQYMITASVDTLTEDTKFSDLTVIYTTYTGQKELPIEQSVHVYQYLANEAGITLTADTPVKDLLAIHGLYKDGSFVEGKQRVSFAGYNGGRSYGEQIDAIVAHILTHDMTLEDVYTMFQTENQQSTPILERDTISGATISFVGDFQRMVYVAIHGDVFQGVVGTTPEGDATRYEVVTQGYGGEMETYVTIGADGKITAISVRDSQETPAIGGKVIEEGSEYFNTIIANQDDLSKVDVVSGATFTSKALLQAVEFALEASK